MNKQNYWLVGAGAVIILATGVAVAVHMIAARKGKENEEEPEPMLNSVKPDTIRVKQRKEYENIIDMAGYNTENKVDSPEEIEEPEEKAVATLYPISKESFFYDPFLEQHTCTWDRENKVVFDLYDDEELPEAYEDLVDSMWRKAEAEGPVTSVYFSSSEGKIAYEVVLDGPDDDPDLGAFDLDEEPEVDEI